MGAELMVRFTRPQRTKRETRGGFGCTAGNQSPVFFCGVEDGTFRLATAVPAPATLGLLGAGLLGLAAAGRRRKA